MNIINLSLYIIIIIYFYCSYIVIYIYFFYIIMRKSAVIFIFAGFIFFKIFTIKGKLYNA